MPITINARIGAGALLSFVLASVAAGQSMPGMVMPGDPPMKMAPNPLGISMDRAGSGTTWTPDASRLPSIHMMRGDWELMLHGFVFAQFTSQDGPRGGDQAGSLNWGMFMATHELAGGRLSLRTMLSLDPWTVTPRGYPLLLQTGETFDGAPLRDRQHPHDFWMELAANYERAVTSSLGFSLYAAPSGEPALAPVAFMHRPSAMDLPFAPLGHHWQDATHVSFGVITAGLFGNKWKLEGSTFNGREPDQNRWDIEPIKLDSYSARLTINPTANWSATAGFGYLKSAEALAPDESMHRVAASVLHGTRIGTEGQIASALIYGGNVHHGHLSNSVLAESEAILGYRSTLLARGEYLTKSAGELVLPAVDPDAEFNVGALTLGYIFDMIRLPRATIGLGAMRTFNFVPADLENFYGSRQPAALTFFVRLRPSFQAPAGTMGHQH